MKLSTLNVYKGPGPDSIPPSILKYCSFVLARPLYYIFNQSLLSGQFPAYWKLSYITPIYKSGNKSDIKNYRPITVLSTIPKLFESLITDYLTAKLSNDIIDEQFGFLAGRSTELNLVTYVDFLSEALENGYQVDAIYTDFSKAFDKVNHNVLMSKLEYYGMSGSLLDWLNDYLTERKQTVRVKNIISNEILVTSGVPQGSHLGPLLFNLFINDIKNCFSFGKILLFADDLKVFSKIRSEKDALRMQADLDILDNWCVANGMMLNINKCHTMRFYRNRVPIIFNYQINSRALDEVQEIKDLGVLLDPTLSFQPHISAITNKALKLLGFVKRTTSDFSNIETLRILYCSLVRPHLEYCSSVWSPHYNTYVQKIESVQHKFLRHLAFRLNIFLDDYSVLESFLNLSSLAIRRQHKGLILLFNVINSKCNCPELLSKINFYIPPRNTRQVTTFYVPFFRTNYAYNSCLPRILRLANQLESVDFFSANVKAFKHQLYQFVTN